MQREDFDDEQYQNEEHHMSQFWRPRAHDAGESNRPVRPSSARGLVESDTLGQPRSNGRGVFRPSTAKRPEGEKFHKRELEPDHGAMYREVSRSRSPRRNSHSVEKMQMSSNTTGSTGMVGYRNPDDAATALETLQGTALFQSPIWIMFDSVSRDSRQLLVSGFDAHVTWRDLRKHFETVGKVAFARVEQSARCPKPAKPIYFHQAFISDIPAECETDGIIQMHHDCGLAPEDDPVLVRMMPCNIEGSETRACITSYPTEDTLLRVIQQLDGFIVSTRSGRQRSLGVRKAKPTKWMKEMMEEQGFVDHEPTEDPQKVRIWSLPAGTQPGDVRKLHEDHGVSAEDFPNRLHMMLNSTKETEALGTVGCFAFYRDRSTAERVVEQLRGASLLGADGSHSYIRLRVADDEEARRRQTTEPDAYPTDITLRGVVESWNDDRAFGFIRLTGDASLPDIFAHQRHVVGNDPLVPAAEVSFKAEYVEAKERWEAIEILILGRSEEDVDKFLEAPPDHSGPIAEKEPVNEFVQSCCNTFCKAWDLNRATAAWLARMDQDVLSAVFEEFDDSDRAEQSPGNHDTVVLHLSDSIYVSGLPRGFSREQLQNMFGRCGRIIKSKILNPGFVALLQMSTVDEATLAVEDLNLHTPDGFTSSIAVRYVSRDREVPAGALLMGTVKTWHKDRGFGYIALNGFGPDVWTAQYNLSDVTELNQGATVLFRADWSAEHAKHYTTMVIASEANVKLRLAAGAGIDKRVRDFARKMERRFKVKSWKEDFARRMQRSLNCKRTVNAAEIEE